MRSFALPVLACALIAAADAPAPKGDRDAIQGTWKQTEFVLNGRARDASGVTIEVDGDTITVKHGDEAESPAPYVLDVARKEIDVKLENEGRTMRGIYKVEGKSLKLCLHPESRPKEFASEAGTGNVLMVFERP